MAEAGLSKRTFTWAPRALAVISCALALLAAQPVAGEVPAVKSRAVVVEGGVLAGGELAGRTTESRAARATVRVVRREATLLSSARHLHILATMEILHRLLVGELRGAERPVAGVVWLNEVCVGVVVEPVRVAGRVEALGERVPIAEREFAIGHCLLAPPIS